MSLALIREGLDLADDALAKLAPASLLMKAGASPPDPLTSSGFDQVVLALIGKLRRIVAGPEKKWLESWFDPLDGVKWHDLSSAERSDLIAHIGKKSLKIVEDAAPVVGQLLLGAGKTIALDTKRASNEHHDLRIDAHLSAIDHSVIEAAASHTALYVRDQYGRRRDALSKQARAIVADGLEKGYDRHEIGKMLRAQITDADFKRSDAYFRMIADVFAARARSYGSLSSYNDAGIAAFELVAVLDEATTDLCRFLDGKVFSTQAALNGFARVEASANPEVVKDEQPWGTARKDEDGALGLYVGSGPGALHIASIAWTGVGSQEKGGYSAHVDDAALQARGLTTPPFHAHCRTTTVPTELVAPAVQVPAASIPATSVAPAAASSPLTPIKAPSALPADIGEIVRPLPTARGVNTETLPRPSPGSMLSVEAQAIKNALAKLAALPPATDIGVLLGPNYKAHGLPVRPGTYDGALVTNQKLAGAKKQKPQEVALADVVLKYPIAHGPKLQSLIEGGSFNAPILIKHGGKLYAHTDAPSIIAQSLLGKTTIQATIIDLDKATKSKKSKRSITLPPVASKAPDASVILHQLDGAAKGSNKGGFYTGSDGVKRYVKFYEDPAQAHCEHLANSIYNSLGLGAPKSTLFEHDGKIAYASEIVSGKTVADVGLSKKHANAIMKGFAADILTGNWDAVGSGLDNAFVLDTGGVMRIDNGGTFLMRAQAGRKPSHLLNEITEWKSFFEINPHYKSVAVAHGATRAEEVAGLADQITKVLDLRAAAGGWEAYVARSVPAMPIADRDAVVAMLEARSKLLEDKLKFLTAPKPVDRPWPGRYVEAQKSNVLPRPGLTIGELPEVDLPTFYGKYKRGKLPSGERESEYRTRTAEALAAASDVARAAIVDFTGSDYVPLREAEAHTDAELLLKGWDAYRISSYRAKSRAIRETYDRVAHEPGTVYRGISTLNENVHRQYLEGDEFALGKNNRPGTASSTWRADIAVDGFMGGATDHDDSSQHKILFILRQKTGISIQTISAFDSEKEILLRADARFRVTGLGRLKDTARVLVVEAEEIDP